LYDQEPERHLRRLLAHGLSHLAGFAHGPEMELLCRMLENPDAEGA
jgi:probable rRNA maturation factor